MRVFLILALSIAFSACGNEERPAPEPRMPHLEEPEPEPLPPPPPEPEPQEPQVCWEELRCQNVEVKTRNGCRIERICRVQKVCEVENSTDGEPQWQ